MAVYKNFSQEELDLQYNVRAGIPETENIFARWLETSEATKARFANSLSPDLRYGKDSAQTIDLFSCGKPGRPLVVFIHGGYWQSLDKKYFSYLADAYLAEDLNFAAINYRLAPDATMDAIVEDCRQAIGFLQSEAGTLGFDSDQIYLTGSSAGGHLVAEMAATDWRDRGLPGDVIKAGCALSGLYDLEPIRLCYLNKVLGMDAEMARRNSPVHNVPQSGPPLLLSYGGAETNEFDCQQSDFARAWKARGLDCTILPQSDGHHFDMVDRLGDPDAELFRAVLSLIETVQADRSPAFTA
ncbi:alpha/beta hydrolase (plasmid) [Paracoccus yeei]|uniref:Alpha/beta hydrolase n=1 Tax=Paracoccus yeei TaxID=147645 RepID=A0A1V0GYG7_9RHOB|nr:alpha/beta hydrolase [Paracoccus yeei]ARC38887.1 alpha/beta hydrolase [Paracoccus yeei]